MRFSLEYTDSTPAPRKKGKILTKNYPEYDTKLSYNGAKELKSVKYTFIVITPRPTMNWSDGTC